MLRTPLNILSGLALSICMVLVAGDAFGQADSMVPHELEGVDIVERLNALHEAWAKDVKPKR